MRLCGSLQVHTCDYYHLCLCERDIDPNYVPYHHGNRDNGRGVDLYTAALSLPHRPCTALRIYQGESPGGIVSVIIRCNKGGVY